MPQAEVRSALAPFAAGSDIAGLIQRMAAVPQATAAAARGNAETETYVSSAAVETCPGVKSPTARPATTGRRVGWKTMVGAAALAAVFLLTVLVAVFNRPIEEAAQTNKSNAEVSASKENWRAAAGRHPRARERQQRAAEGREEGRRRDSQASRVPGSENASSCG